MEQMEQTRADKSLRSILAILESLEYEINIFQKTMTGKSWNFSIQLKESLPPTSDIPIPILANHRKS